MKDSIDRRRDIVRGQIMEAISDPENIAALTPLLAEFQGLMRAHGLALARKWMKSKKPMIASAGWCTYSAILATWDDEDLDLDEVAALLDQVVQEVHSAPNRVRYAMNNFVISVGTYITPLLKKAKQAAKKIGPVSVDMGDTACKVPLAVDYIAKVESMKRVGKKRKTAKC
jgi:hypothetical protein